MSHVVKAESMPRAVPPLLGFIAGFVDICAYFALFGIFVAQLTGSFVLAGARLVSGQQELMTLLAIPMFFVGGVTATGLGVALAPAGRALASVLALESLLLTALLGVMVVAAPPDSGSSMVIAAALIGISAMGVQSAAVRLFMKGVPSTNVMTTNTTQLAIDVAITLLALLGCGDDRQTKESRARLADYWPPVTGFIIGTAAGALCFHLWGVVALGVPTVAAYALFGWALSRKTPRAA